MTIFILLYCSSASDQGLIMAYGVHNKNALYPKSYKMLMEVCETQGMCQLSIISSMH